MIHTAVPQIIDPFAAAVERTTGQPIRHVGHLPCAHVLQWGEADCGIAGLVHSVEPGQLIFHRVTFSETLRHRLDITAQDLAACCLAQLGLMDVGGIPRPFRRSVRLRLIPAALVARHAATA
ncbi:hypothetical protein [Paracoccus sp. PAR01]|uniref:hypothetical protein n=1 Tax=Paracoccus sp. PAR01 TaxID=2769282 RepID=UPI0017865D1C|nr:hypothetical protein [Paracoccus sp. PAR01]MBD9527840.1 hypothetical protein [Paracoccus sp. PAR01]